MFQQKIKTLFDILFKGIQKNVELESVPFLM